MINLTAVIENDEAIRKLKELQNAAKTTTSSIVSDADRADVAFRKLGSVLGSIGVTLTLKEIAGNMARIRGEFQQLEIAFSTMLGSKEKADKLMADTVRLAATTPFDLQGVASGVKQLIAYGSETEDVIDEMKMLGNIAAGLSIPIGDLVYLYGTTRTQGRLFTMDLRQFMSRGIPLADELAKQFGVTKDNVSDLVTSGKVGFDNLKQALVSLTSEGGMFFNLMEKQSKSITGQLSNLEDSLQQMWNELGQSQEASISASISGVSYLVENYEKVLRVLFPIVSAYGAYKAAVMLVAAAHKVMGLWGTVSAFMALAKEITSAKDAMLLLNMAVKSNPLGLLLSIVAGLGAAVWQYSKNSSSAAKATEEISKVSNEESKALDETFNALKKAEKGTKEYKKAIEDINSKYGGYLQNQLTEASNADEIANAYKRVKDSIRSMAMERAKNAYLSEPVEKMAKAENTFWKQLDDATKELNNVGQGIFVQQVSDYLDKYMVGQGNFDFQTIRSAFTRAAQLSGSSVQDILEIGSIDSSQIRNKTFNLLQAIQAYSDAQKGFEEFQKGYGELEDTSTETEKAQEAQNKKYWENIKKSAQDGLDAMTVAELQSEEAQEIRKKIIEADKMIAQYSNKESLKFAKKIEEEKRKAQEEANKAELAQMAAQTEDKVAILEAEKDAEVKAIEERIKDTTDAETIAALERKKAATIKSYDANIEKERKNYEKEAQKAVYDAKREGIDDELELLKMEKQSVLQEIQDQIDKTTDLRTKAALEQKKAATEQLYNAKENSYFKKLLDETATYEEKRNKLIEEYQKKRARLIEKGEMDNVAVLDKQHQKDLWNLNSNENETYKKVFRDASRMTRDELKKTLKLAEETLEKITDPEQVEALSDKIKELKAELENSLTEGFSVGIDAVIKAIERLTNATEAYNKVKGKGGEAEEKAKAELEDAEKGLRLTAIGTSVDVVVKGLSKASALMKELAEASGDVKLKEVAEQIDAISQTLGNVLQGFAQGGIVGGIASIITTAINAIGEATVGVMAANAKLAQSLSEFRHEVSLLSYKIDSDNYDTIFGTNAALKAADAYEKAQKALYEYNLYVKNVQQRALRAGGGGAYRTSDNSALPDVLTFEDLQEWMRKGAGLENLIINTTQYSAFAKLFGQKDEYKTLKEFAPKIFKDDGTLDVENAKLFLNSEAAVEKLTDAQRESLQYAIDLNEAYQECEETLKNIATDIMGEMASSMSDAIFDAVDNGADAWADFESSAANAIKNIAKMMLESWLIEGYLSQYQEDFKTALGTGDRNAMTAIIGEMASSFNEMYSAGQDFVNEWYRAAEEQGIDLSSLKEGEKQSATSRGFNAMSQDTGDELNGRFTDIQGKMAEVLANGREQLNQTVNIRDIMIQINGNVADIRGYTKVLPQMSETMTSMNKKLDNI